MLSLEVIRQKSFDLETENNMSETSCSRLPKNIIFVTNNLKTGGVQTSLLNLLKEVCSIYQVTLVSFCDFDKTAIELPNNLNLIILKSPYKYLGISKGDLKKKPFQYVARSFFAVIAKLFGRSFAIKLISIFQKKIK